MWGLEKWQSNHLVAEIKVWKMGRGCEIKNFVDNMAQYDVSQKYLIGETIATQSKMLIKFDFC